MIRPVLYVDLPGIIHALDHRARLLGRPFATFVCAPAYEEMHSGLAAWLNGFMPVRATARTWICEEHWRLLGVAQAYPRPRSSSWDLVYLASLSHPGADPQAVLHALLEYVVNAAMQNGTMRVFARTDGDPNILNTFHKVSFQRYAQELLYVRQSPVVDALNPLPMRGLGIPDLHIRRWHQHDRWGLTQLYSATTPRKVQIAENVSQDEVIQQMVPRERAWRIPGVEPRDETYVVDLGSHLAAWVRLRQGWAGLPHQVWLKVHPDHTTMAREVLRFALDRLCQRGFFPGPDPAASAVICQIRDYDGNVIDTLRQEGFSHADTKDILVRHLTLRAFVDNVIPGIEHARIKYGVEGLGSVQSSPIQTMRDTRLCNTRSPMISTPCSPPCPPT